MGTCLRSSHLMVSFFAMSGTGTPLSLQCDGEGVRPAGETRGRLVPGGSGNRAQDRRTAPAQFPFRTSSPSTRCSSASVISVRVAPGSSACATISAASSSAPRRMWASGGTGRGQRPGRHRRLQGRRDHSEAVLLADLPPPPPAQHPWGVQQQNAFHVRLGEGVEKRARPRLKRLHRIRGGRHDLPGDPLGQLRLDRLHRGVEQIVLVPELVVERPRVTPAARTISSVPTPA